MDDYFHESIVAKMIAGNDYQQGYSVGFNSGYKQGRKDALEDYRKWMIESPTCNILSCNGRCIECFIRYEEQRNEV